MPSGKYRIDLYYKGGRIRITAFTDKRASRKLEENIKQLAACIEAGERPDKELNKWIGGLSQILKGKLAKYGLISKFKLEASKSLIDHLKEYKHSMIAKNRSIRHINQETSKINKIIFNCNFMYFQDIQCNILHIYLYKQISDNNMGARTANSYGTAFKSFLNWLKLSDIIHYNPLDHLPRFNEQNDIRHKRRAISVNELLRLLNAALNGSDWRGINGYERYLLYLTAMETGLRWSELRSLKRNSFDFTSKIPTVTIEASYTKNHKNAILPIKYELMVELQKYFSENIALPTTLAFPNMPKGTVGAKMIRYDLANTASKNQKAIPYKDSAERVADFHSLRHSFITALANSGVHPATAQKLARHSSIELTINRYTHSILENQLEAVEKLPSLKIINKNLNIKEDATDYKITTNIICPDSAQIAPKLPDFNDNNTNQNKLSSINIKNAINRKKATNINKKASSAETDKADNMGRETGLEPAAFRATI